MARGRGVKLNQEFVDKLRKLVYADGRTMQQLADSVSLGKSTLCHCLSKVKPKDVVNKTTRAKLQLLYSSLQKSKKKTRFVQPAAPGWQPVWPGTTKKPKKRSKPVLNKVLALTMHNGEGGKEMHMTVMVPQHLVNKLMLKAFTEDRSPKAVLQEAFNKAMEGLA